MTPSFPYDVFLSFSSADRLPVQAIAERLRDDGLKIWYDKWVLKPDADISTEVEKGLEESRALVLCMSGNTFDHNWAQFEAATFRFRDPLNKDRRFIPLRLDDAPIKASLSQFLYVDWRTKSFSAYRQLRDACSPQSAGKAEEIESGFVGSRILHGHTDAVNCVALSADGRLALSGSWDRTLRLWDVDSMNCLRVFKGHTNGIRAVAFSANHGIAISASGDKPLRVWDIRTGECRRVLSGHKATVHDVALSGNARFAVSCSADETLRVWDVRGGFGDAVTETYMPGATRCVDLSRNSKFALVGSFDGTIRLWGLVPRKALVTLKGHVGPVNKVRFGSGERYAVSASGDSTVRLWDLKSGRCLRVLEGHGGPVHSVAADSNARRVISGSEDKTVRVWDMRSGQCLRILKGHEGSVHGVDISADGSRAISCSWDSSVWWWDLSKLEEPRIATPDHTRKDAPAEVHYSNAKVLLVGDSGVGKSGLSNFLAHGIKVEENKPLSSTDGAWATHWPIRHAKSVSGVDREIWLWDFAGQVDYRLVHQLFMDDAAAAILVFNPQNENPFEGLGHWDRDLQKAARKPFAKLLVAGRTDRGGLVVSDASVKKFIAERGFLAPLRLTSAKTGEGCEELRKAILDAIDWEAIPETTSPALYQRMKHEILNLRDNGLVLIRLAELKQRMEMTLKDEAFQLRELEAVVTLLAGPGMIQRLEFGGFILMRPEIISRYAAAVVRKVRKHPQEMGCIREDELLAGDLDYQDFDRLPREDEAVVLRTLLETFISRAWCLRQPFDGTAILTFPSYFRRERKEQPSHPSVLVTYRFDGPIDDIYATLVVQLHHTLAFESTELWKSAADFKTQTGVALGFTLARETEGTARLEVYFEPNVDPNSRVLFLRYVHEHLTQHAKKVIRLRHYACGNKKCDAFGQVFGDRAKIDKALAPGGKGKVFCSDCGKAILLRDMIEQKFDSAAVKEQVRELQAEAQVVIDNESRELLAVHHSGFIVAESGQIYRGYTNSDHGIDAEIEFKDDEGRASGQRLYLQLKSGDSYLKKRQRDAAEVFQIKNARWADYWQQHAYTVMLVIRTSDGVIRWMNVSDYLKREAAAGKSVTQIVFTGEPFDVMSVRRWRDALLSQPVD